MNKDITKIGNIIYIVNPEPFEVDASEFDSVDIIYVPEDCYDKYIVADTFKDNVNKIFKRNYNCITVTKPDFCAYFKGDELLPYIYKNGGCASPDYMTIGEFEGNYITFEDANVKSVIVSKFGTNGEITYKQASEVTNEQFEGVFNQNKTITKFNEFVFFTGITKISLSENKDTSKTSSPFRGCSALTEITLPPSLIDLGYRAFDTDENITKINLEHVIRYGYCACQGMGKKAKLVIRPASYIEVYGGTNFSLVYAIAGKLYVKCLDENGTKVMKYHSTDSIRDTKYPLRVIFDSEVIGESCFSNCRNMVQLDLKNTKTITGSFTVEFCTNLKEITIIDSVTSITGSETFAGNTLLKYVTINANINSLPYRCFKYVRDYADIVIPDCVETIGAECFEGSTEQYGGIDHTNSIIIGKGVKSIGDKAFNNRGATVKEIQIKAINPPTTSETFFGTGGINSNCIILVPKESVEAYKSATGWSKYANQIHGTTFD